MGYNSETGNRCISSVDAINSVISSNDIRIIDNRNLDELNLVKYIIRVLRILSVDRRFVEYFAYI